MSTHHDGQKKSGHAPRRRYDDEDMARAVIAEGGVVTKAAARLGCHPETIRRRRRIVSG